MRHRDRTAQRGFTLVELMISLVIFSFAVAGILAVATSMTQAYREQRNAVQNQSAVRVPLDFIADSLRQVSPGVSTLNITDGTTGSLTALTITNGAAGAADMIDAIYASGAVVTSTTAAFVSGATTMTVQDASQLAFGDGIVITNYTQGHFFWIKSISGNTLTLDETFSTWATTLPSGGYPAVSPVIRAAHTKFSINSAFDTVNGVTIPALVMQTYTVATSGATPTSTTQPLAEGIEDMQVALGVDSGTDGVTEGTPSTASDEVYYNDPSDSAPVGGTVRFVRVSLVAKSPIAQIAGTNLFAKPPLEDRTAAGTADNYPRRVLRTTVEFRNIGVSP